MFRISVRRTTIPSSATSATTTAMWLSASAILLDLGLCTKLGLGLVLSRKLELAPVLMKAWVCGPNLEKGVGYRSLVKVATHSTPAPLEIRILMQSMSDILRS